MKNCCSSSFFMSYRRAEMYSFLLMGEQVDLLLYFINDIVIDSCKIILFIEGEAYGIYHRS